MNAGPPETLAVLGIVMTSDSLAISRLSCEAYVKNRPAIKTLIFAFHNPNRLPTLSAASSESERSDCEFFSVPHGSHGERFRNTEILKIRR